MGAQYREEVIVDSANLLISILVRYPEIEKIKYDPHSNTINSAFIINQTITGDQFAAFRQELLANLSVMHILEDKQPTLVEVSMCDYGQITLIQIKRDVITLTQKEIALVIQIMHNKFKHNLMMEKTEHFMEEDLLMQEEFIKNTLENVKGSAQHQNLIAFREEGRVLVFNK